MVSQREKADRFRKLHEREGAFVIPNPWDAGSARLLAALGYEALATTSYGFALSLGRYDGMVTLEEKLAHCRALTQATDLPVSADLEDCFATDFDGIARTIQRAAEAGVVGCSIEDYTRDPSKPIYDFHLAVERVHAAVEAARALPFSLHLDGPGENFWWGKYDLDDTIRRLQAFEEAGADVLYAPGLRTLEEVRIVASAVSKPINVLAPPVRGATVKDLAAAGAKRISLGGALARAVFSTLLRAGEETLKGGSLGWLDGAVPAPEVKALLAPWAAG